jgi:chromosome segregation ATPase
MSQQCDERIASLVSTDNASQIVELQRQIRETAHGGRRMEAQCRQLIARITVCDEECEKLQTLRSNVQAKLAEQERIMTVRRAEHEEILKKSQRRIDVTVAKASEITDKTGKMRSKRSAAKLAIRQLTKRIVEVEEVEEKVRTEAHKMVSTIAVVTADVNLVKLKTVEIKQDGGEMHDNELAGSEKRSNLKKRMAQLQTEIAQTKEETRGVLFRMEKIKASLDQQNAGLADDELRIQDFHEIMDEIDSSERDFIRLEDRWREIQTQSLDLELRSIDVGRERGEIMDRIHVLKVEFNEEQTKISIITDKLSSMSRIAKTQHTEASQMEYRKSELVTIRNSLYAPNRESPQGLPSSKVIRGTLEARSESRNRKVAHLQKKIEKLEDQTTELSTRNSQRRMKSQRKELTLQQSVQMSKDLATSGIAEEKFIGLNSVQDFRRLLRDEIQSWKLLRSHKVAPLLNSWERKINELFEVLDSYYLQ